MNAQHISSEVSIILFNEKQLYISTKNKASMPTISATDQHFKDANINQYNWSKEIT